MTLSPELEAKFQSIIAKYPPDRKRSAVIPMLLYGQDAIGSITRELVEEVARRTGQTTLSIDEVVTYYSMLHRKPMGHAHVQICTNISCMLNGGEALWNLATERLGIGHKETTADGKNFARGSGMHRSLFLGAGYAGQLRFPPPGDAGKIERDDYPVTGSALDRYAV